MIRRPNDHLGRTLVASLVTLALAFGGCRASFSISPDELARARTLPPDALVRGFGGNRPVTLRAEAVKRSLSVSSRGDRLVEDPGINLRRAAWGAGGTAIGMALLGLPIASITSDSETSPYLIPTLIVVALTGMAIGFGAAGNLEEDEFMYSNEPLAPPQPQMRPSNVDEERRLKEGPVAPDIGAE